MESLNLFERGGGGGPLILPMKFGENPASGL